MGPHFPLSVQPPAETPSGEAKTQKGEHETPPVLTQVTDSCEPWQGPRPSNQSEIPCGDWREQTRQGLPYSVPNFPTPKRCGLAHLTPKNRLAYTMLA